MKQGVYPYSHFNSFERLEKKITNENTSAIKHKQIFCQLKFFIYLNPCHYVSTPRMSYNAILKKMTVAELELFFYVDLSIYLFTYLLNYISIYLYLVKKVMGGRASYIVHRYSWGHDMYMYGCAEINKNIWCT